ncbi:DUF2273 domain-containing protein [Bacillus daqingensis]|uniref:DUF2273 domain-containing protein n=1 Tax=Bacillus daqingensis TaxID=872396 RepID=A0ABV9NU21_9BACI
MSEATETFKRYRGRILGLLAAVLFTILLFTVGFWYTVLIFTILILGYLIGRLFDQDVDVAAYLDALFGRRN